MRKGRSATTKKAAFLLCLALCAAMLPACSGGRSPYSYEETMTAQTRSDVSQTAPVGPAARVLPYFDPYVMTKNRRESLLQEQYNNYMRLVDTVIEGNGRVDMTVDEFAGLGNLLAASLPLARLVLSMNYSESDNGVVIKYRYNSDEHNRLVDEFAKKIDAIKKACESGAGSDTARAMSVYTYVASNTVGGSESSSYAVIMEGRGNSEAYAGALEFLLLQAGIPCLHITGVTKNNENRAWTAAMLGGKWYHLDASRESWNYDGKGLTYFGLTDAELEARGVRDMESVTEHWETGDLPECADARFSVFRDCSAWAYNGANNTIEYSVGGSKEKKTFRLF